MNDVVKIRFWQGRRARRWLPLLALFGLALALRLLAQGRYVTPDELIWVYRSVSFREALADNRFANTLVAGHPGVTTTWLGALALSLQLWLRPADAETYAFIRQMAALTPDNTAAFQWLYVFLGGGRAAVALVTSLGIVAVYVMAARLFGRRAAFVAALLLALDPFVAGLSGLFHVDGLLTTFVTISLLGLALAAGWGRGPQNFTGRVGWTAVSAAAAALAVLSKTPALLLLPVAALVLASGLLRTQDPMSRRLRDVVLLGLVWLAVWLLVVLLLFPALWSDPAAVYTTISGNTGRHVEEALRPTFFLGDVSYDHGLAFYPIAVLWRMTPLVLAGLALLGALLWQPATRGLLNWRVLLLLGGWVLLFLLVISVAAKKFDRYALPVFPALALLAGVALARLRLPHGRDRLWGSGLLAFLVALQMVMLVFSMPYLLSAYNLLVGGPYTAQRVLPIGWGESVSAAGRWLAAQPGAAGETAVTGLPPSLAPFFPGETLSADSEGLLAGENLIVTVTGQQEDPAAAAALAEGLALRHTARYGLLAGSWTYANPRPQQAVPDPQPAPGAPAFGDQIRLLAQELSVLEGGDVRYTAVWQRLDPAVRPWLALTVRDAQGEVWSELRTPLLNETAFYPPDWVADEQPQVSYLLKLPAAVPPGVYALEVSLLDGEGGSLLPVREAGGSFGGVAYQAGAVDVRVPPLAIDPGALGMAAILDETWAAGGLRLLGRGDIPDRALGGGSLPLALYWQALEALPPGLALALQLGDEPAITRPLSGFDSGRWEEGRTLMEKYRLPIAADLPAGTYPLVARLVDGAGRLFPGEEVRLGEVKIDTIDRLFTLPQEIAVPLDVNFEQGISLRGVSPAVLRGEAGETLPLTLIWQGAGPTVMPLTAFVHLIDAKGEIVAQADRWPGGLPSDVWGAGQVIIDEHALTLPPDLPPGSYLLGVGLYDAQTGARLAASDAAGQTVEDGRLLLPVPVQIGEGS